MPESRCPIPFLICSLGCFIPSIERKCALHQPNSERSVLVPVLNEELTTQTFVVPKEFADRLELHAFQMIEAIKDQEAMPADNQLMQAMSYILQTAVGMYLDQQPGDEFEPPEISGS